MARFPKEFNSISAQEQSHNYKYHAYHKNCKPIKRSSDLTEHPVDIAQQTSITMVDVGKKVANKKA